MRHVLCSLWRDRERAHGSHAARGLALARGTQFARGSWSSAARHRVPPPEPQYKLVMTTSARMLWRKKENSLRFSLRPRMSGMAKSLRGKCVSWLTSVARAKHAARAPGIEVAVTGGRAGARQEESMHSRGQGRTGALTEFKRRGADERECDHRRECSRAEYVSGQGARESGTSLQTQCGRASQHTRSVDAAGSAFNVSSMTF